MKRVINAVEMSRLNLEVKKARQLEDKVRERSNKQEWPYEEAHAAKRGKRK